MNKKFCQKCGKQIDSDAEFCPYCGASQNGSQMNDNKEPNNGKSNMITAFKHNWDNAFFISGRTSRANYWFNFLDFMIIGFISYLFLGISGNSKPIIILYSVISALMGVINFTSMIRRLHDTNRSGHFLWLFFIPIIGSIILLVLFAMPTKPSDRFNITKSANNIWYKKWWTWVVIALVALMYCGTIEATNSLSNYVNEQMNTSSFDSENNDGSNNSSDSSSDSDSSDNDNSSDDSSEISSSDVNPDDYKNGTTYDDLARNPDQHKDDKVSFTGKVVQTIPDDDDSVTQMRVAINGDYDNMMLVDVSNDNLNGSRVLENDKITFYGDSGGIITYKSTMGAKIQIPGVKAYRVDDKGKYQDSY